MSPPVPCRCKEPGRRGIRVNCVAPRIVESDVGLDLVLQWTDVDDPKEQYGKVPFDG